MPSVPPVVLTPVSAVATGSVGLVADSVWVLVTRLRVNRPHDVQLSPSSPDEPSSVPSSPDESSSPDEPSSSPLSSSDTPRPSSFSSQPSFARVPGSFGHLSSLSGTPSPSLSCSDPPLGVSSQASPSPSPSGSGDLQQSDYHQLRSDSPRRKRPLSFLARCHAACVTPRLPSGCTVFRGASPISPYSTSEFSRSARASVRCTAARSCIVRWVLGRDSFWRIARKTCLWKNQALPAVSSLLE